MTPADLVPEPRPDFALPPEAWDRIVILDGKADTARRDGRIADAERYRAEAERVRRGYLEGRA